MCEEVATFLLFLCCNISSLFSFFFFLGFCWGFFFLLTCENGEPLRGDTVVPGAGRLDVDTACAQDKVARGSQRAEEPANKCQLARHVVGERPAGKLERESGKDGAYPCDKSGGERAGSLVLGADILWWHKEQGAQRSREAHAEANQVPTNGFIEKKRGGGVLG